MIPNIFISSTIADLHYLREAIRDAVNELGYNPVMSEDGGVGYIQQGRAAEACYVAVKHCHMAVLMIGKRYGDPGEGGKSVTHKEFLTARENELPLITFVDTAVMTYKKVFDTDPAATIWDKFAHMQHPKAIFALIDEVQASPTYNGLIEFSSASEAKHRLKQQIAHYVGERLSGNVRPIKTDVSEILAEVKTLRQLVTRELVPQEPEQRDSAPEFVARFNGYYTAMRFLLDERRGDYTKFVEVLFGDMDLAVRHVLEASSLDQLITAAGATISIVSEPADFRTISESNPGQLRYASQSIKGSWALLEGKKLLMTANMRVLLDEQQRALVAKLQAHQQ